MKGWFGCWTWVGGETWASWALADLGAMPNLLAPPAKVFVWTWMYNCDSPVDCAFHLHLVLRLAQFVLIVLGHIVLRLVLVCLCLCACTSVLVCLCTCVPVCLCTCVPNLAKSTRLASWKALKKPSSGPMHEHWAPKEVSLGFNFEFCKYKWWALNKQSFFWPT